MYINFMIVGNNLLSCVKLENCNKQVTFFFQTQFPALLSFLWSNQRVSWRWTI